MIASVASVAIRAMHSANQLELDHPQPLRAGGDNSQELAPLCSNCHAHKSYLECLTPFQENPLRSVFEPNVFEASHGSRKPKTQTSGTTNCIIHLKYLPLKLTRVGAAVMLWTKTQSRFQYSHQLIESKSVIATWEIIVLRTRA